MATSTNTGTATNTGTMMPTTSPVGGTSTATDTSTETAAPMPQPQPVEDPAAQMAREGEEARLRNLAREEADRRQREGLPPVAEDEDEKA